MKIRSGFVSNSSSSSFIVAFEKLPESAEEIKQMLFGNQEIVYCYDECRSANDIAERVFQDFQEQPAPEFDALIEVACRGSLYSESCMGTPFEGHISNYNFHDQEFGKIDQEIKDKYGQGYDNFSIRFDKEHKICSAEEQQQWCKRVEEAYEIIDKKHHQAVEDALRLWMKEHPKSVSYRVFHYSDNDGEALLEHGEIFAHLPCLRISQH